MDKGAQYRRALQQVKVLFNFHGQIFWMAISAANNQFGTRL